MDDRIERIIKESISAKEELLRTQAGAIAKAAAVISGSLDSGGKVLIFGNGGSAADSQHMAAELVGRFKKERKALAAVALTVDTSSITAIANDYGYDRVFSRQIDALGRPGDVAFGISTSGSSPNVLLAVERARSIGMKTIGLTGAAGKLKGLCDVVIACPAKDTARVQECHITAIHALCELIEEKAAG
jgi:D-sedoheptulose 7-phosphate isomerase